MNWIYLFEQIGTYMDKQLLHFILVFSWQIIRIQVQCVVKKNIST